ncbi:MAG: feruloyl-CoA synthase [Pseudomonadota bacterium]
MTPTDQDRYGALFAEPRVTTSYAADGSLLLEHPLPLPKGAHCVTEWLLRWAREAPDRVFLAERDGDGWHTLTYARALTEMRDVAGWILSTEASPERPVMALSGNAVDLGVLSLAAMHVGVPIATVSTAYSLMSKDHGKLTDMTRLLDPAVIYVEDTGPFAAALDAIAPCHRGLILASADGAGRRSLLFSDARAPDAADAVSTAFHEVGPDTIAKLLFTSGSTGTPKAVINTHRMLTASQEAHREVWTHLKHGPPVLVDWLPWSHTFGANFCTNMVLRNGGSMYIDDGKPVAPLIGRTVENFKSVRPTMALNVPRGYGMLAEALAQDTAFREIFFNMDLAQNAGAALPPSVRETFRKMSIETVGSELPFVASWGSTETSPLATHLHFPAEDAANIGLPVPGTTLKLVADGGKHEVRVKGPNVTPGYFRNPTRTAEAFDQNGFYRIGDALRLADANDPAKGLCFDGRVSEDFKLSSGTWVSSGELRLAGIDALAPLVQDIVVAGQDRDFVGFLLIPNPPACRRACALPETSAFEAVVDTPGIRDAIAHGLADLKSRGGGTSRYAARARFLLEQPDPDQGEITDKAYLNQRQILENRAYDVDVLFGDDPGGFIVPARPG